MTAPDESGTEIPGRGTILHADIDAFFASVEELRFPHLRGRPVIVGTGVIASCSYAARRAGLRAGMSLAEARRRCPAAVILPGHAPTYRCFAERIFALCRDIAPVAETFLDDAYLDLTGTARLYPDPRVVGRRLREHVHAATGLRVTVGIGANRMIARLASHGAKPDGLAMVPAAETESFLRGRPAGDLPGVGHRTRELLHSLAIETVDDLRRIGEQPLRELLGAVGTVIYQRAWGRDTRPVSPRELPRTISRETSFEVPATDPREIDAMLTYLVERAARTARRLQVVARTIRVQIDPDDGKRGQAQRTLAPPTAVDPRLSAAARGLCAGLRQRRVALRRVGVTLAGLAPAGATQLDLLAGDEQERQAQLTAGVDLVRERYGHAALVGGRSINLLGRLERDPYGFILRTPCLTR